MCSKPRYRLGLALFAVLTALMVGSSDASAQGKTSTDNAITVTIDLKQSYQYEITVDNTDVGVIFTLIPPKDAEGSPKAKDGQPFTGGVTGGKPYYRCYLKTLVDSGQGGTYTLRIISTDDKKGAIVTNYTLNIKATAQTAR